MIIASPGGPFFKSYINLSILEYVFPELTAPTQILNLCVASAKLWFCFGLVTILSYLFGESVDLIVELHNEMIFVNVILHGWYSRCHIILPLSTSHFTQPDKHLDIAIHSFLELFSFDE